MMNITINQITPRWENKQITTVIVHFSARSDNGTINLNGNIPIEDFTDTINFDGIENEVRQELIDKIISGEVPNAE